MMYPRLLIARTLLSDDGVIFISIDDNEVHNLRKLCDEVFGEDNFINNFLYLHGKGKKDSWTRTTEQYILAYARNKSFLESWSDTKTAQGSFSNPDNDPRGDWFSGSISFSEDRSNKKSLNYFTIKSPSGIEWTRQWQCTRQEMDELLANNKIYFGLAPEYANTPRIKIFPTDRSEIIPSNLLANFDSTRAAQKYIDDLFQIDKIFDNPKPVNLIQHLIKISSSKDSLILDFFSGSSTTAHAVMQLNAEDGGKRQFIMVQLPEVTDEKSEAYKAGYKTIADIGKERIRRAGEKILAEYPDKAEGLDIGFKVFKLDSTNLTKWDSDFSSIQEEDKVKEVQHRLQQSIEELKPDRSELDLLYEIMLKYGLALTEPIVAYTVQGKKFYAVGAEEYLFVCLDNGITREVIASFIEEYTSGAVMFSDNCFSNDSDIINVEDMFSRANIDFMWI